MSRRCNACGRVHAAGECAFNYYHRVEPSPDARAPMRATIDGVEYRDVHAVPSPLLWECAYCGGLREAVAGCPGCGAPRTVAGYGMTMEIHGRQAFRGLRFDPAPPDEAGPIFVFAPRCP